MRPLQAFLVWAAATALVPILASAQRTPGPWLPVQGPRLRDGMRTTVKEDTNANASVNGATVPAPPPTRVGPDNSSAGLPIRIIDYPLTGPYGPVDYPGYTATPEILSQVGEMLGAINNPDERSQLAKQWLQYSKKVIDQNLQYRQEWLALQKAQLSQLQQVEQLRMEVAKLQAQIEALRAQNAQLEQQNLQAQASRGQESAGPPGSGSSPPFLQ